MKFTTSPAYSFSLSKKCEIEKDDKLYTPGPERYYPKKLFLNVPTCKIGLSKRIILKIDESPGPGAYNIPSKFPKGLKFSIRNKLPYKFNKEQMNNPGPGTYKIMRKSQSSFYSFGMKYKEKKIDETPGPGRYNLRGKKDSHISSYIFGKEKRYSSLSSFEKETPGPGRYNHNEDAIKIHYPQFSFGKEERKSVNKIKKDTPGPGSYDHKEYIGKEGFKISISPKYEIENDNNTRVGPGKYNKTDLNFYKPKSPSTKIGKFKRFSLSCSDLFSTPGPGKYNYTNSINVIKPNDPAWKIGKAKRKPLIEIDYDIPGPGKYDIIKKIGNDSPYYTIGHKEKEKKIKFNSPGPGRYNLDRAFTFSQSPKWKIGTSRKLSGINFHKKVPGPGSYDVQSECSCGPKFGFSKEKRAEFLTTNDFPGPGAYHIPCSFEELNTYTRIKGKFNEEFRYI